MIPAEMPGWVIALPLLTIVVIDILWGLDLMLTAFAREWPWWRVISRSGSFWLGVRFVVFTIILPSVLGIIFLLDPDTMRPTWFGIGAVIVAISSVLAWWLLTFTVVKDTDDGA